MRIGDVEKQTGISRKTIRFYEQYGLISVNRSENSYRDYGPEVVGQLRAISQLRRAGVSLADIQLWQDSVITYGEMLEKRIYELRDEADERNGQIILCRDLLEKGPNALSSNWSGEVDEKTTEEKTDYSDCTVSIGIDIGTTTISSAVLTKDNDVAAVYTLGNLSNIPSSLSYEHMQDPVWIHARVSKLLDFLIRRFPKTESIGFSGQMHGILYLDGSGTPVSPFYTWQDRRAVIGKPSAVEEIEAKTGYRLSAGYGFATHYTLMRSGRLPENAAIITTIMDYISSALCGIVRPLIHVSNAASLGLFDISEERFMSGALASLGIDGYLLPEVCSDRRVIGYYRSIPVTVAIGDNQASFFGAVKHPESSVLTNFGTGSQISVMLPKDTDIARIKPDGLSIEIRPLNGGRYLMSGSALCGGRAYAILEHFFREYLAACGISAREQYDILNKLSVAGLDMEGPTVNTTFCGTRSDPGVAGAITGITDVNFTPQAISAGVLLGMARELHDMFEQMPNGNVTELIASGNAARKNPALIKALSKVFGIDPVLPDIIEEAACGAAVFARGDFGF